MSIPVMYSNFNIRKVNKPSWLKRKSMLSPANTNPLLAFANLASQKLLLGHRQSTFLAVTVCNTWLLYVSPPAFSYTMDWLFIHIRLTRQWTGPDLTWSNETPFPWVGPMLGRVCGVALLPIIDAIGTPLQSNIVVLPPSDFSQFACKFTNLYGYLFA